MGVNYYMNYYLREERRDPLHIGKSAAGWCFGLHVIPEEGLNSLDDWRARWSAPDVFIVDEYGVAVSPTEMEVIITQREWRHPRIDFDHVRNHAVPGPKGLVRHRIWPDHCIGHGEGTWDLLIGEFS